MGDHFLFLLGSGRKAGNCEILARRAAAALEVTDEARWIHLADLPLEPFIDTRHADSRDAYPIGNARILLEATLWASDLVIATPTYWFNLPASTKLYFDHWSGWMRVPEVDFKNRMAGRRLWAITVNADEPGESGGSEPLLQALKLSAEYMGMTFAGALVGHGNRPGDIAADAAALEATRCLLRPSRRTG